jgi:hypothetical protein
MHWFTVAAVGVLAPVMVFTMSTEQVPTPPPPLRTSLHWVTDEIRVSLVVTSVEHSSASPAAPPQATVVMVALSARVPRSRKFATTTRQSISWPAMLGVSLHCETAEPFTAADALGEFPMYAHTNATANSRDVSKTTMRRRV